MGVNICVTFEMRCGCRSGGGFVNLTVVVPTYNEKTNVISVANAIHNCLAGESFEVLFVDDSTDAESLDILNSLAAKHSFVRVLHRHGEKGLGTAVVRGFEEAKGQFVAVMDADMQHPPEVLAQMLERIREGYDIVIPSRFIPGGDDGGLSPIRKFISWGARVMGQALLKRVRRVTDPTSGFFMMRKNVIQGVVLQPIGWKILMEVLVRGHYQTVLEIPYCFHEREAGASHMSFGEQVNYLRHLASLFRSSPEDRRFYVFCMVGGSGVILNQLIYVALVHMHVMLIMASVISAGIVLVSNFLLNDRFTWKDAAKAQKGARFLRFATVSVVGIGINELVLALLAYSLSVHYLLANLGGIAVATIWNYFANHYLTWNMKREPLSHARPTPEIVYKRA